MRWPWGLPDQPNWNCQEDYTSLSEDGEEEPSSSSVSDHVNFRPCACDCILREVSGDSELWEGLKLCRRLRLYVPRPVKYFGPESIEPEESLDLDREPLGDAVVMVQHGWEIPRVDLRSTCGSMEMFAMGLRSGKLSGSLIWGYGQVML